MKNSDRPNIERLLSDAVNSFSSLARLLRFVGFTLAAVFSTSPIYSVYFTLILTI